MAKRRSVHQKQRVDFRQNRSARARAGDWTREFQRDADEVSDTRLVESVRPKGELSRKRTIGLTDDGALPDATATTNVGTVTAVYGLVCRVCDDRGMVWDCTLRRVLKTLLIEQRSAVTVGDRVAFAVNPSAGATDAAGVIDRIEPRRTLLSRRVRAGHDARRDRSGRQHLIVANADQLLIVASVARPALKPHLIDRYLVAAHKGGLRPIICFNKIDLIGSAPESAFSGSPDDESAAETAHATIAEFEALGISCFSVSAATGDGVTQLAAAFTGHITVVSGQSGVGKSSLLNAIQPGLRLTVGEVSDDNDKGRHTTSHAELYRLDNGGFVVDTPGVRQFDIWNATPGELEACFVEFLPHLPNCRFHDCTHRHETDCGVIAAVNAGAIGERRYESYLKMFAEV